MITAITPLVQGASGGKRWGSALVAYAAGSITASALVGSLLGLVGRAVGGPWPWGYPALLLLAFGLGLSECGFIQRIETVPRRQTCSHWRFRYGARGSAFLWGVDLGLGLTTRVSFSSYWVLVAACLVLAEPGSAAMLLGGYGLGRSLLVATGPLLIRNRSIIGIGPALLRSILAWRRLHSGALFAIVALLLLLNGGR